MSPQPSFDRCHLSAAICNRVSHLTANTAPRCPIATKEEHCTHQTMRRISASRKTIDDCSFRRIWPNDCRFLLLTVLFIGAISLQSAEATPVLVEGHHSIFQLSPSARNIRHLPCVSRRTKEEGICMFAIDCLKANGTHLGTCIDRFYFGSCCQVPDAQADPGISDNRIEDNTVQGRPVLSNSQDNYDIKPTLEKTDLLVASDLGSVQIPSVTSQKPSVVNQNVSPTNQKPYTGQNHVVSSQTQNVSTAKPGVYLQKPSASTGKPSVASHQGSSTSHRPYRPTTVSNRPSGATQNLTSFTSQKPAVTNQHKPSANTTKQPIPVKPTGSAQKPEFNNQKPGYSSVKPTVSTQATTLNSQKPESSGQKPSYVNQKPGVSNQKPVGSKPGVSPQHHYSKPGHSNTKQNSTVNSVAKPGYSSQPTRRPHPATHGSSIATKKPITTGVVVNNTYTSNFNYNNKIPSSTVLPIDRTEEKDKNKVPDLMPSLKPARHNATSVQPYSTSTYKPFYLPSRPTKGTTQRPQTTLSGQSNLYVNNELYNSTRPGYAPVTRRPVVSSTTIQATTEVPIKLSTFQTVELVKTSEKPTTSNIISSTINTASVKPSNKPGYYDTTGNPPSKPLSDIPFGTRLPSSTLSPLKPSTPYVTRPTVSVNTISQNFSTYGPTTTVASPQTQRPIQKPTPSLRPDRPSSITVRPAVQRPQNSTLSNRRTTTPKPSSVVIKDQLFNNQSNIIGPTKRPVTTVVYRPSLSTQASAKPPNSATQKPTTTIGYQKPTTTTSHKPAAGTTSSPIKLRPNVTTSATVKPIVSTQKPVENLKPKPEASSTVTQGITITDSSTKPSSTTQHSTTSVNTKPNYSIKPTSRPTNATKKPILKPTVTSTTARPVQATVSSLNNEVDGSTSQKPTAGISKPEMSSTEKVGLVTWTNFVHEAVTQGTVYNTTKEDQEEWSPATPPNGWVLLQTVSTKKNISTSTSAPATSVTLTSKPVTISTEKPNNTPSTNATSSPNVTPSDKPVKVSVESTTTSSSLSSKPNKPVFTVQVTTRPAVKPMNESTTQGPSGVEFSTFMTVSGGPSTQEAISTGDKEEVTTLQYYEADNETLTTVGYEYGNETGSNGNLTLSSDDLGSTEKSTVSPIEIITSTGSSVVSADSLNMSDYKDVCGRRLWPGARVVGGARAQFGRWPWQVSLRQWRTSTYLHKCGAALLSDSWAVTAAHCVDSVPPSDLLLRLGEHDLASEEEPYGFQERRVQIVASHPQFDPRTFEYDLALLRFYEPVTFQPNILPVCVPTSDEGFVGKTAYVTGWGRLYEDGPLPSVLQEVSVPVLENSACESMYSSAGYIEHIPHIFICAGWRKGGFDSCEGDSGGPMVLQREDKRFILAGIISWGIGCAEPNQPGVYTRISEFRDWINQILQF